MTRENVYERLNPLFRTFFDDESIVLHDETTADDIGDWDSFEHINLMVTVEEEFNISIPMGKAIAMKNVGELVDIIIELGNS